MGLKDETGNKYDRLTVIERGPNTSNGTARWRCKCDCGNEVLVIGSSLRNGQTRSCGCLHKESASQRGKANTKTNNYTFYDNYVIGYTSSGKEFYFDKEDYDLIKDYCWNISAAGYVYCKRKENVLMYRLIMGNHENYLIDHINHVTYDNRKSNLRICTSSQNQMNKGVSNKSQSGVRGVYWYSQQQKWSAEIIENGNKHRLGLYDNIEEAIKVRKEAEEKYFKEYAYREGNDESYD